jgi:hypothetical protein
LMANVPTAANLFPAFGGKRKKCRII